MMRWFSVRLLVFMLVCSPRLLFALSGDGGNLKVQNGTVSVTGTSGGVPYFSAANTLGTSGALSANQLVLGGGAGAAPTSLSAGTSTQLAHGGTPPTWSQASLTADVSGVLPTANGGRGDNTTLNGGRCMRSSDTTHIVEASGDCAVAGANLISFSTNGDLTQATTVYMAPGVIDTSQTRAQQIVPNTSGLNNMNCVSTAAAGSAQSYTMTMATGACTGALTNSTLQICTISGAASRTCAASPGGSQTVTAGQCWAVTTLSSATAATSVVSCSLERVS